MKGYWYILVSMKRGDSYLSPCTKIIRLGGFTAKIKGGGGNHSPFGGRVKKNGSGRQGLIQAVDYRLTLVFHSVTSPRKYPF